ncbi:hypothetical protein [Mangrovihabitans endophyticus]|uniref:Uncharacterized protein n=1 Tax=Mangrovihabitans endophyticus TaxID=1751298 RepID=A0A8J3FQW2_9ACTN|nr:hypothetical protein [Mangrovihabitans endophyticus]GGL06819.1 hypothetical protein GCM10012284_46250 [Mangrovihabitans endophyticus]
MIDRLTSRLARMRRVVDRATLTPFLLRCGIAVCGAIAMLVAWPAALMASRYAALLLIVAVYPAVVPRGRGATLSALVVVAGWIVDTTGYGAEVALWRVLSVATLLYLGHSLTALAAVLPYDAVVNLDVVGSWGVRALVVVLISAVLTVIALGLASALAGGAFLVATMVGLCGAVGATLLLTRLLRRA